MLPTLSSPSSRSRAHFPRWVRYAVLAVPVGAGLGFGCGGSKGMGTTSGFGGTSSTASTGTKGATTGTNGTGGTIFQSTVTSGPGGSGTGAGGPVCDTGTPTTGPAKFGVQGTDPGTQNILAVATDPSGNALIAGAAGKNAVTVSGTMLAAAGANISNAFVAKIGSDGTPAWGRELVATGSSSNGIIDSTARAVVADQQGNVYVGGDFNGNLTLGSFTITSAGADHFFGDGFVAELDPTGQTPKALVRFGDTLATTPVNGGGAQQVTGLAVHTAATGGLLAVIGQFEGQLDLTAVPSGTVLNAVTASDMASPTGFVVVLRTADDSVVFEAKLGDGSVIQNVLGVAFDKNGDVLVTGNTPGAITFPGGPTLMPTGAQAAFVAKIKGDGSATSWAKLYGDTNASGAGVASDANGDVFVAGQHTGSIDFGGGALAAVGGSNAFVAKLDTNGKYIWANTYGNGASQAATGIGVDATGHAVVTGNFTGTINFGNNSTTTLMGNANFDDIFVAKLDTHGCQFWAKGFGDTGDHASNGVAVDAMGNTIIAGHMSGTAAMATMVNFGTGALTAAAGVENLFVAKFGP